MFAEISADVYIMVDGDGTYDASAAPQLVGMIINDRVDMAIGVRANVRENAHRAGHALGNRLFNSVYKALFGYAFGDMLSGYRAFSRRTDIPSRSRTRTRAPENFSRSDATQLRLPIGEIVLPYRQARGGLRIEIAQRRRRLARAC